MTEALVSLGLLLIVAKRAVVGGPSATTMWWWGKTTGLPGFFPCIAFAGYPETGGKRVSIGSRLRRQSVHAVPREPLDDALERMAGHAVTAVPVLDPETEKLLAEITSGDICSLIMDEVVGHAQLIPGRISTSLTTPDGLMALVEES